MNNDITQHKAAVVVPVYCTGLEALERKALRQLNAVLGSHPIIVVAPQSLDTNPLLELLPTMSVERFEDSYFAGIEGYNRLMLSHEFYERFAAFGHILIYQTDAWVFENQLLAWCDKGYDYIGAPWLPRHMSALHALLLPLRKAYARLSGHSMGALRSWKVGNGGFSLRRPSAFLSALQEDACLVPQSFSRLEHNEDVFWSITMRHKIRTPHWSEALAFAIESRPDWALRRLSRLPFGCHGWNKPPYAPFWQPIIK